MKKAVSLSVLFVSWCASTHAEELPVKDQSKYVNGITAISCSKLLDRFDAASDPKSKYPLALVSWMEGYVSAVNNILYQQRKPRYELKSMTLHEYWATIYGFCKRNPNDYAINSTPEILTRLKQEQF